jgi:ATP-dependent protease ClpP protease subunit
MKKLSLLAGVALSILAVLPSFAHQETRITDEYVVSYIDGEIDDNTTALVAASVAVAAKVHKKVLLEINSPGGRVSSAYNILNIMHDGGVIVDTHDYGSAASAASIILMSGHHRTIAPCAWVLTHYSRMSDGSTPNTPTEIAITEVIDQGLANETAYATGKSIEFVHAHMYIRGVDAVESPQTAIDYGLVDGISVNPAGGNQPGQFAQ